MIFWISSVILNIKHLLNVLYFFLSVIVSPTILNIISSKTKINRIKKIYDEIDNNKLNDYLAYSTYWNKIQRYFNSVYLCIILPSAFINAFIWKLWLNNELIKDFILSDNYKIEIFVIVLFMVPFIYKTFFSLSLFRNTYYVYLVNNNKI